MRLAAPLLLAIFLAAPVLAQTAAIDPPMTAQEQQMVAQMEKSWQQSGMPPMTDEQVAAMVKKMRATRISMMGFAAGMQMQAQQMHNRAGAASASAPMPVAAPMPALQATQAAVTPAAAPAPAIDMTREIAARSGSKRFTRFEPRGDGFLYDGTPYIDADGKITAAGFDAMTGWVSYLVDQGGGRFLVKHQNVHSSMPPLLIGELAEQDGRVEFRSYSGATAGGDRAIPTSNGILIARDQSLVDYDLDKGLTPVAVPQGFTVATYQHGDVAGTGYVLLERIDTRDPRNPATQVKEIGSLLGAVFGKEHSYDYALFNLRTQSLVPLNIAWRGKTVSEGTGCRRQNALVNRCSGMRTWDSIWETDGRPNIDHYYWALSWYSTKYGPIAVAEENMLKDVDVIALQTGTRYNAFHRGLGIDGWKAEPTADGSLDISAKLAFTTKEVPDVGALLATPPMPGAPAASAGKGAGSAQ